MRTHQYKCAQGILQQHIKIDRLSEFIIKIEENIILFSKVHIIDFLFDCDWKPIHLYIHGKA